MSERIISYLIITCNRFIVLMKTRSLTALSCGVLQGYAYTFIIEEQGRYAGDIIKALELSGSAVPPELEKLWASFKDQQKAVSVCLFVFWLTRIQV